MIKPNDKTTVGMLVEKLTEFSMKHPQAQVYCQTGDFGPCVDYNIVNCAEEHISPRYSWYLVIVNSGFIG